MYNVYSHFRIRYAKMGEILKVSLYDADMYTHVQPASLK